MSLRTCYNLFFSPKRAEGKRLLSHGPEWLIVEDAKREFAWVNVQIQIRRENFDSFGGPLYVISCPFFKSTMTNEKFFRKYQKIPYHCTRDSLVDARDLKSEVVIVPPIRYFRRNTQNATKLEMPHPGNFRIARLAISRPCVNTCPELSTTDVTPRLISSPTSLRMNNRAVTRVAVYGSVPVGL